MSDFFHFLNIVAFSCTWTYQFVAFCYTGETEYRSIARVYSALDISRGSVRIDIDGIFRVLGYGFSHSDSQYYLVGLVYISCLPLNQSAFSAPLAAWELLPGGKPR
ncbi:hypothetical protein BgiMline_020535 [Biomphalaria glabrata]|nr:hypothetical protein BgiMline_017742 [Biomphalaria glabrata]